MGYVSNTLYSLCLTGDFVTQSASSHLGCRFETLGFNVKGSVFKPKIPTCTQWDTMGHNDEGEYLECNGAFKYL